MDVSRSGDPSSIPGRIWEWISVLMGKKLSLADLFLKMENMIINKVQEVQGSRGSRFKRFQKYYLSWTAELLDC
jgi:hypothetical protein